MKVGFPDIRRLADWRGYTPSAFVLIGSNILTIIVALLFGLDPSEIIWIYWLESIVIGAFTVLAFLAMALGSAARLGARDAFAAIGSAAFFTVHYGIFHGVYALFMSVFPWFFLRDLDFIGMGIATGILAMSHAFSFITNVVGNPTGLANTAENRERLMTAPYSRIIPMHITIILSGFLMIPLSPLLWIADAMDPGSGASIFIWSAKFIVLLLFMSLKTAADLVAHLARYRKH